MYSRLFLFLSVALSTYAYGMEEAEKKGIETSPASGPLKLIEPHVPITTGFFDCTLQDSSKDKEAKLKLAHAHVLKRQEKYELFLDQINATYSRRAYQDRDELRAPIQHLRDFFEDKLLQLENKLIHFKSHMEDLSPYTKEHFSMSPIGTYSGKLHGQADRQSQYASEKYREYLFMVNFIDQFPLPKVSTSPIIQRAIREELNRVGGELGKSISHRIDLTKLRREEKSILSTQYADLVKTLIAPAQPIIDGIITASPQDKLNELIGDKYSLQIFAAKHLDKWLQRMSHKEKELLTSRIFKLLIDSPNLKENKPQSDLLKGKEKELNVGFGEKEPVSSERKSFQNKANGCTEEVG